VIAVPEPTREINEVWYCNHHKAAALEIAEGLYLNAAAHHAAIGRRRGYPALPAGFSETLPNREGLTDYALGAKARQSSGADEAARALLGTLQNPYAFSTEYQDNPWWEVDLGAVRSLSFIVVHNACKGDWMACRATPMTAAISFDGTLWLPLFTTPNSYIFGRGGKCLTWTMPESARARYLRLTVERRSILHLRQVQVLGPARPV
jgi:hypothetical protein